MRKTFVVKFLIYLRFVVSLSSATLVWKPHSVQFPDRPAKFAVDVNKTGTCGALHVADPPDGCSPLSNPVASNKTDQIKFVLIVRGRCSFEEKIQNAEAAGYGAAIVYNDRPERSLVYMAVNRAANVHAVFVSLEAGVYLKEHALGQTGECCIFPESDGQGWTVTVVSVVLVMVAILLMTIAYVTPGRWIHWQGQNQQQPGSLDSKVVETLPCFVFSSASSNQSDGGEMCAICLEDYQNGEKLRVLPCKHEFHSSCVDSWLTKWGTFCPVCKFDVRTSCESKEIKRETSDLESAD